MGWKGYAMGAVLIVGGAGAAYVYSPSLFSAEVQTVRARRDAIIHTLVASGRVETRSRVEIASQIMEEIERLQVKEGDYVIKRQILARLDTRDAQSAVMQAQIAVRQAEAKLIHLSDVSLPSAERSLDQAVANRDVAKAQYERTLTLERRGFATRAQRDEVRRQIDVAEAQVSNARLLVGSFNSGGSEVAMADIALETAKANLASAQTALEHTIIRAPTDGIIIARKAEAGALAQPGKAMFVLAPTGETRLAVQMDERNLGLLAIGQTAIASAEAYPDKRFSASISYIDPAVDALRGSVLVKLTVADPPPYLREDMTVSVDIEVAHKQGALVLDAAALHDAGATEPFVYVLTDGKAVRRPIRTGVRGSRAIEVLSGLSEIEEVIPATYLKVRDGARVRKTSSEPSRP